MIQGKKLLILGKQGENNAVQIKINVAGFKAYGDGGAFVLTHTRADGAAYPVSNYTVAEDVLTWYADNIDNAVAGMGSAELAYILNGVTVKSETFETEVYKAKDAGEAPAPYESWLDNLAAKAAETLVNAESAKASKLAAASSAAEADAAAEMAEEYKGEAAKAAAEAILAKTSAVSDINAVKGEALGELETKRSGAINDLAGAKGSALTDIESKRSAAVSDVAGVAVDGKALINSARDNGVAAVEAAKRAGVAAVQSAGGDAAETVERLARTAQEDIDAKVENVKETVDAEAKAYIAAHPQELRGKDGDDYTITEADYDAIASKTKTKIQPEIDDLKSSVSESIVNLDKADAEQKRQIEALKKLTKGTAWSVISAENEAETVDVPSGCYVADVQSIGGKSVCWNQYAELQPPTNRSGITFTKNEAKNSTTMNGTSDGNTTATGWWKLAWSHNKPFNSSHKYYVKTNILSGTYTGNVVFGTTSVGTNANLGDGNIVGIPSDGNISYIAWEKNTVFDNLEFTVLFIDLTAMFGAGNEPTSVDDPRIKFIESYASAHPEYNAGEIISADVTDVVVRGKNLWDIADRTKRIKDAYISNGEIAVGGTRECVYIECEPNTTYSISRKAVITPERLYACYCDETPVIHTSVRGTKGVPSSQTIGAIMSLQITTDATAKYLVVWAYWDSSVEALETLQIEKNSVATEYSPYTETRIPIPEAIRNLDGYGWGVDTARNEVDYENKRYIKSIKRAKVRDIIESVRNYTQISYITIRLNDSVAFSTKLSALSVIPEKPAGVWDSAENLGYMLRADTHIIYIGIPYGTTREQALAMYGDVDIYYKLAEPIVTDISDLLGDEFKSIDTEPHGSITFSNENHISVKSKIEFAQNNAEV